MKFYFALTILILLSACGSHNSSGNRQHGGADNPLAPSQEKSGFDLSFFKVNSNYQDDKKPYDDVDQYENNTKYERKITYYYSYTLEVDDVENKVKRVEEIANTNNGYVQNKTNGRLTLKIPTPKVDFVISEISQLGEIVNKYQQASDITSSYYDAKLRLENMLKTRERYLELLAKAENVETTLKVERELERLLYDIESLKGQIEVMQSQVDFTTITVNLEKSSTPGPVGWIFYGLYKSIKWLIVWD